jgi:UDP-N-acetylmuramoyl-tripeptide--D-alanyl-D-alanine ligase
MTVAEIARVVGGRIEGTGEAIVCGVEVDSRRVAGGDLFVALPGAHHDGHEFTLMALETAAAALVRDDAALSAPPTGRALVRVNDPLAAYHELARHERRQRPWRVAAVTGSVAKTTTKDFLAALLAPHHRTGATGGNRNSTLGLPAELLSQDTEIEIFVAEAGMSRAGELAVLGEILRPQVLVYTRIAPVHTEFFPDLSGIVRAKAELLPWLDPDGVLVINADDPSQRGFAEQTRARVLWYGAPDAEARIEDVEDQGLLGSRFKLVLPDGEAMVELAPPGRHQAENLLAAAAGASAFGITADQVAATAPTLCAPEHRGRIFRLSDGISLVDDSYNASPLAVRRMLELLGRAPGRRVAVLGEMYELGALAAEAHHHAGEDAAGTCDLLVVVGGDDAERIAAGARAAGMPDGLVHRVAGAEDAAELLAHVLRRDDVVLVKGSRGVGLDRMVAALVGDEVG